MRRPVLFAALLVAILAPAAARADLAAVLQDTLDAWHARSPSAPGVLLHVVCPPAGLDTTFVSGTADRDGAPLGRDATFRIASNTKTYVAAAVLRLAEEGRLDLDEPLDRHLRGDWAALLAADGYDLDVITLTHVLSHTSGLFEHPADPRYEQAILADPQHAWTADEQVHRCVEWGDPVAAPGDTFSYSDTGYILLGSIVEDLTGRKLGPAVHALLGYEGLGLDATWWETMEDAPAGAGARCHQYFGDRDATGWNPSLDLYGGGGLVSDARDLAWFLRDLMQGRVFRDTATLAAMTGRGSAGYRLGLFRTELAGHRAWGHTGFWNTFAFHVPDLDLTVAGCVTDHFAGRGRTLAESAVAAVAGP